MAWYRLLQPLRMGRVQGDPKKKIPSEKGRDYPKGVQELPESLESHPEFLHFVKCGLIVEAEKPSKASSAKPQDPSKLLEKLKAKRQSEINRSQEQGLSLEEAKKKHASKKEDAAPEAEEPEELEEPSEESEESVDESAEGDESHEEKKSKHKHKKAKGK